MTLYEKRTPTRTTKKLLPRYRARGGRPNNTAAATATIPFHRRRCSFFINPIAVATSIIIVNIAAAVCWLSVTPPSPPSLQLSASSPPRSIANIFAALFAFIVLTIRHYVEVSCTTTLSPYVPVLFLPSL